jgi:prepilin-type N-terminal cleavage/methylation domain-containing protein/prepilin-type processing-associated H-X9-DG protein
MKKNQAFTLIELLVVISIIAILAGFALPVFTRAVEKGRATEDKNNLQNIGKGILMYMNDNDGSMFTDSASGDGSWPNVIRAKYIKDWTAFRSPFDKITASRPKADNQTQNAVFPVSYGLNTNLFDTFEGKWKNSSSALILGAPAVDTSSAGRDVKFLATAFSNQNVKVIPSSSGGGGNNTGSGTGTNNPGRGGTTGGLGTHAQRGSINVLFADGHVTEMDWFKYIENSTPLGQQRWDPNFEVTTTQ